MELIKSCRIEYLIGKYKKEKQQLSDIFETVNNSERIRRSILPGIYNWNLKDAIIRLNSAFWDLLLKESQMYTLMDRETKEKWTSAVFDHHCPEFTEDIIIPTVDDIYKQRKAMRQQAIIFIYKTLSWNYKSNLPEKFGKKIVFTHVSNGHYLFQKQSNTLDDIQREHLIFDGKPEADNNTKLSSLLYKNVFCKYDKRTPYIYEDEYFVMKMYKNGNLHLIFKRPDIVEHLNKLLAEAMPDTLVDKNRNERGKL